MNRPAGLPPRSGSVQVRHWRSHTPEPFDWPFHLPTLLSRCLPQSTSKKKKRHGKQTSAFARRGVRTLQHSASFPAAPQSCRRKPEIENAICCRFCNHGDVNAGRAGYGRRPSWIYLLVSNCGSRQAARLLCPRGRIEFSRCIGTIPREVAADRVIGARFHSVRNCERWNYRSKPAAIAEIAWF